MSNYKLSIEIKTFIINQKKSDPSASCRNLVPLIEDCFKVRLSKSLINNVIKEANLSSSVGRRVKKGTVFLIDNAGYIFLKAADIKLLLTSDLTTHLSVYFPHFSWDNLLKINEILIYFESFKKMQLLDLLNCEKSGLWWLLSVDENTQEILNDYWLKLSQFPLTGAMEILNKLKISHNIIKINELYKKCLLQLSSYVQSNFFPIEYQFLDFFSMKERFYRLPANIQREQGTVKIQFFYPPDFFWMEDSIWLEGILCAIEKFNQLKIFVKKNELIMINPSIKKLT